MPRPSRFKANLPESGVIGWISISEVFLLCGVTMLGVAMAVESKREEAATSVDTLALENEKLRKEREEKEGLRRQYDEAKAEWDRERRRLDTERADAEARRGEFEAKLATAQAERARLAEALDRSSRELATLRDQLDRRTAELASRKADADRLRAELERSSRELATLRDRLAAKDVELAARQREIDRLRGSIFSPLGSAKVIVKVSSKGLPANYDLDLFVQDPHNDICSWNNPRTLWESDETGLMMLSEDIQRVNQGEAEEIYYSPTLLPTAGNKPYLVMCMIRERRPTGRVAPIDFVVHWEISVDDGLGLKTTENSAHVREVGRVTYLGAKGSGDKTYGYPGLVPLARIEGSPAAPGSSRISEWAGPGLLFRGFGNRPNQGGIDVNRAR